MPRFTKSAAMLTLFALLVASIPIASAQSSPFTIQADADLQPALEALYSSLSGGGTLTFVDEGGDLLATADAEALAAAFDGMPAYFLPGAGLAPLGDNADAQAFIDFAVSVDGQAALIAAGFLPEVVTITDQGGNEIAIPQPVRRILTPYAIGTYLIYGVNAEDRLVAANYLAARGRAGENLTRIDPRFPDLSSVMEMGQDEINIEEAAAQEPDVILTSTRTAWIDAMRELGILLVLYEGETPEALKESVLLTAAFLGPDAQARAEAWVEHYDDVVAQGGRADGRARRGGARARPLQRHRAAPDCQRRHVPDLHGRGCRRRLGERRTDRVLERREPGTGAPVGPGGHLHPVLWRRERRGDHRERGMAGARRREGGAGLPTAAVHRAA
ncbi:MAG: ABC transporter substrate-binding protein [Anaerolineae bacterium]|nr:ABC transporter substrate-binding protein [Anaerolineae bacterium]